MTTPAAPPAFPPGVSQPAIRGFATIGVTHWTQLAGKSESALLAIHGVGPKAIRIIREALAAADLPPLVD